MCYLALQEEQKSLTHLHASSSATWNEQKSRNLVRQTGHMGLSEPSCIITFHRIYLGWHVYSYDIPSGQSSARCSGDIPAAMCADILLYSLA